jgi:hypothetical protein
LYADGGFMNIEIATVSNTSEVIRFFNKHLSIDNEAVYSPEFFCPDGVKAAVRRGQVLIASNDKCIIAALRFYKRKTKDSISLYQFAVDQQYRGKGLIQHMLKSLDSCTIEVLCPAISDFNIYFVKTGWTTLDSNEKI